MASDILDLLDTLKLKEVSVVGWSDGGIIGLLPAIHHPEKINKLFAFGANSVVRGIRSSGECYAYGRR